MEQIDLHFHVGNDGITAETHPIDHERGIVQGGSSSRHGYLVPIGHGLSPMPQAHLVIEALDGLVFGLEPGMPVALGFDIERGFGEVSAQPVVHLPGD